MNLGIQVGVWGNEESFSYYIVLYALANRWPISVLFHKPLSHVLLPGWHFASPLLTFQGHLLPFARFLQFCLDPIQPTFILPRCQWKQSLVVQTLGYHLGNGCDSVGRVVASNTRGPQFESNDCQIFYWTTVNCTEKTIIKKNRPGMSLFEKTLEGPTESSLM